MRTHCHFDADMRWVDQSDMRRVDQSSSVAGLCCSAPNSARFASGGFACNCTLALSFPSRKL